MILRLVGLLDVCQRVQFLEHASFSLLSLGALGDMQMKRLGVRILLKGIMRMAIGRNSHTPGLGELGGWILCIQHPLYSSRFASSSETWILLFLTLVPLTWNSVFNLYNGSLSGVGSGSLGRSPRINPPFESGGIQYNRGPSSPRPSWVPCPASYHSKFQSHRLVEAGETE